MSNKTQLQTNNTKLDNILVRINDATDIVDSLPDAGSGGGSNGVSTCTINIFINSGTLWGYVATVVQNGETRATYTACYGEQSVVINNCVCRSAIVVFFGTEYDVGITIDGDANYIATGAWGEAIIQAPTTPDSITTIVLYDDD